MWAIYAPLPHRKEGICQTVGRSRSSRRRHMESRKRLAPRLPKRLGKMACEETPSAQRKLSCAKQELEEVPNGNCRWL
jgi:hypothetical protein